MDQQLAIPARPANPEGGAVRDIVYNSSFFDNRIACPVRLMKEKNAMNRTLQRLGAGLAAIVLAAACSPAATPAPTAVPTDVPAAERTGSLTVLEWAGYDAPDFWTDF